ncbi:MAG: radical SAM protein [Armatimonadota bacterium]|nr:radical SAM protein [bacterium]
MNIRDFLVRSSLRAIIQGLVSHERARGFVFDQVEKALYKESIEDSPNGLLNQVQQDRLDCASALLHGLDRIISRGIVSKNIARSVIEAFLGNVILNADSAKAADELGFNPPSFITISPTGRCNLKCRGCYASDAALQGNQLSFETFDRILTEKRELWGSHFTVISGGEPFIWEDKGHDLIEIAKRHPQDIFLVYTNGTLIDDKLAERIADAANITPGISVEGFARETNARRGDGVYLKILSAMNCLRNHGVPFGISATATSRNWETVTSEEFTDFFFTDQGALYCWMFQYMPIGRDPNLDLLVPPEARVQMLDRMWRLVRERKVFMVDFWNSGTASLGCIAAGRPTGYFHINWDGDIMPCVFTPYAADNINELYARGENLNHTIQLPFFKRIREWQRDYGYDKPMSETGNWLCPCAIRDHFDQFSAMVKQCNARPINPEAKEAIEDPVYYQQMVAYGERMRALTDQQWDDDYTHSGHLSAIDLDPELLTFGR